MLKKPTFIWICALATLAVAFSAAQAETLNEKLQAGVESGDLPGLHGAIVDLGGERLAEVYFGGADERWGQSLGRREHSATTLHDLRSVTKSVVGLLYGIALSKGQVPAPSSPLYAAFPQYADLAKEAGREQILIRHVLTMQMGLEWNEDLPYTDPRNSEIAMENAEDRYRYILAQPIREAPGKRWIYSGGAAALIGKLIEDGTGKSLDNYAREVLFTPLGIKAFEWIRGADGVVSAASGLRLTLPDLVRIGQMVADGGRVAGETVVPEAWLKASFTPRVELDEYSQYGYLWYLAGGNEHEIAIAVGNGGQRLTVQPGPGLVVANFAGRYNDPESWQTSLNVVLKYAVPEARARLAP